MGTNEALLKDTENDQIMKAVAGTYVILIFAPLLIEAIVVSQQTFEMRNLTILVCGILQAILAVRLWGLAHGIKTEAEIAEDENGTLKFELFRNQFSCYDYNLTDHKSLLGMAHIIYMLPGWIICNLIVLWININKMQVPAYVHVFAYWPLISYVIFFGGGCIYYYNSKT